jgi:hypothetical protein
VGKVCKERQWGMMGGLCHHGDVDPASINRLEKRGLSRTIIVIDR